ncbi:MAG: 2OG-Fe(II) oxygenase [Parvularculaceae bacterium]|nr:2OG-Fe(II) oxygenase [Parvularculaceae bacterium]
MQRPTVDDLKRAAETGDARAQYALAAALSDAGRREEADIWLKRAAAGGDAEAHYTLATRLLQTRAGIGEARELLRKSASGGSTAAARALAVVTAEGFDEAPDWPSATAIVLQAARDGDPAAMRDLAGLLMLRHVEDADGDALLAEAASRDAAAAAALVRRAAEGRGDSSIAGPALERLAAVNYPRVQALRAKLATAARATRPGAAIDHARIAAKLRELAPALGGLGSSGTETRPSRRIAREALSRSPETYAVRAVVPPEIAEYVMAVAALRLAPSMTFDPATGVPRQDEYRTSLTATLGPADQDLTLVAVSRLLADVAGADHARGEFLSVLRYAPGQEYRPHFDWIPEAGRDFASCGQRVRTALLYLNDEYDGGETHFLASGLKFKGAPGDVLVFANVTEEGAPDMSSRHAGLPVRAGVKWLASKWFREREYVF